MRFLLTGLLALIALSGCSGQQVLNSLTPSRGYDLASNLVYDEGKNLRLDVYTPKDAKNAPVVVFFFGGTLGLRVQGRLQVCWRGAGLARLRCRAARLPPVPAGALPGLCRRRCPRRGLGAQQHQQLRRQPRQAVRDGPLAGAHLAAMLAVKEEFMARAGGSRSWLRGMIGLAGPYDFLPITDPELRDVFGPPENFEQSQPVLFTEGDNPPMLLMHGENDETVWVKNTRNLAAAVKKAGGPVETVIYPKMSHSFIIGSLAKPLRGQTDVLDHISEFVNRWANAPRSAARPAAESGIQTMPLPIQ